MLFTDADQDIEPFEGFAIEVVLSEYLAVGLALVGSGVFRRLGGSGGVEEINGHHARVAIFQRPCGGELEVALGKGGGFEHLAEQGTQEQHVVFFESRPGWAAHRCGRG